MAAGDGSIKLWKWTTSGFAFWTSILEEQDDGIITLAVKNGTTLYAGLQGGTMQIFDLHTLSLIRTLAVGDADILSIVVTDDGCLATTADGMLHVFSHSFMLEAAIKAHEGLALSCHSALGGRVVYTGGNDGTLKIWHFEKQQSKLPTRSEALQGDQLLAGKKQVVSILTLDFRPPFRSARKLRPVPIHQCFRRISRRGEVPRSDKRECQQH